MSWSVHEDRKVCISKPAEWDFGTLDLERPRARTFGSAEYKSVRRDAEAGGFDVMCMDQWPAEAGQRLPPDHRPGQCGAASEHSVRGWGSRHRHRSTGPHREVIEKTEGVSELHRQDLLRPLYVVAEEVPRVTLTCGPRRGLCRTRRPRDTKAWLSDCVSPDRQHHTMNDRGQFSGPPPRNHPLLHNEHRERWRAMDGSSDRRHCNLGQLGYEQRQPSSRTRASGNSRNRAAPRQAEGHSPNCLSRLDSAHSIPT